MGKTKDFSSDFNSLLGGDDKKEETPKVLKKVAKPKAKVEPKTQAKRTPAKRVVKKVVEPEPVNPIPPKRSAKTKISTDSKRYSLEDATEVTKLGRATKGRKKFTMMMRPDIRDMLNRIAINKRQSISDVIENVLCDYFDIE